MNCLFIPLTVAFVLVSLWLIKNNRIKTTENEVATLKGDVSLLRRELTKARKDFITVNCKHEKTRLISNNIGLIESCTVCNKVTGSFKGYEDLYEKRSIKDKENKS